MQDVVNLVQLLKFQSTPSARRATDKDRRTLETIFISIHALREEGDGRRADSPGRFQVFQSTPSARRATNPAYVALPYS